MTLFAHSKHFSNDYVSFNNMTVFKNLAFIAMFIDHLGFVMFPDSELFRFVGRFAFPVFAFIAVYNFLYNVKFQKHHLISLFTIASISQIPYYFVFQNYVLNVFFTFFFALTAIYFIQRFNKSFFISSSILIVFLMVSYSCDYSIFGFIFIISVYFFLKNVNYYTLFLVLVSSFFINFLNFEYSLITLFFTVFILLNVFFSVDLNIKFLNYRFDKYFYYIFYPYHLSILALLALMN